MKHLIYVCALIFGLVFASCGQKAESTEGVKSFDNEEVVPKDEPSGPEEDAVFEEGAGEESDARLSDEAAYMKFIPEGFEELNATEGDLNLDGIQDLILVVRQIGEAELSDEESMDAIRPLLILTGNPDKSYTLRARNNHTVLCYLCGGVMGDPFTGISIKNGYFSVEHYGGSNWRWVRIITYKYSKADDGWFLHKDGSEEFQTSNPDEIKSTILTTKDFGKVKFEDFDIDQ